MDKALHVRLVLVLFGIGFRGGDQLWYTSPSCSLNEIVFFSVFSWEPAFNLLESSSAIVSDSAVWHIHSHCSGSLLLIFCLFQ